MSSKQFVLIFIRIVGLRLQMLQITIFSFFSPPSMALNSNIQKIQFCFPKNFLTISSQGETLTFVDDLERNPPLSPLFVTAAAAVHLILSDLELFSLFLIQRTENLKQRTTFKNYGISHDT